MRIGDQQYVVMVMMNFALFALFQFVEALKTTLPSVSDEESESSHVCTLYYCLSFTKTSS